MDARSVLFIILGIVGSALFILGIITDIAIFLKPDKEDLRWKR
jgi:hypothetical protein